MRIGAERGGARGGGLGFGGARGAIERCGEMTSPSPIRANCARIEGRLGKRTKHRCCFIILAAKRRRISPWTKWRRFVSRTASSRVCSNARRV